MIPDYWISQKIDNRKHMFNTLLENQNELRHYPQEAWENRQCWMKYLISICFQLNFNSSTLYRAIYIYDLYISYKNQKTVSSLDPNLTIISCLNISVKLNEWNTNYTKFFAKYILSDKTNNNKQKYYEASDIAKTEIEILSTINYNTIFTNIYHINAIFMEIVMNNIESPKNKFIISNINKQLLENFSINNCCVNLTPINGGIIIINKTLQIFFNKNNGNNDELQKIINKIIELKN
ncbi:MAG: hypothetical protein ACRC42_02915 [Mycoplasma sp.]